MLELHLKNISCSVTPDELAAFGPVMTQAHEKLMSCPDLSGWLTLPRDMLESPELPRILDTARHIRENFDVLVVIGVGGSYLGARAFIDMLRPASDKKPEIFFLGTGFNPDEIYDILESLEDRDFCINVISKSGGTMEPAITLRIFREYMLRRFGPEGAAARTFATTDPETGALRQLSRTNCFETFSVPGNVGGRYSVLSAVGLLPMAAAGIDIEKMLRAAAATAESLGIPGMDNPAWLYAAARNLLYKKGKKIEILAYPDARMRFVAEWWKQLFGESEGKDGRGIFPASAQFPADLHSIGQYIQQGERHIFETAIVFREREHCIKIPACGDYDGLSFMAGMEMHMVERASVGATLLAHADGSVPNCTLFVERRDAQAAGELIQFFETACALSAFALGVNPFDQPGVEAYKRNVSALLGRPGLESVRSELEKRKE